jgi:biopolymer transport protein ExbB/TolQ
MSLAIIGSIATNFKHDPFMWPIAASSLVGIAIVVERFAYLHGASRIKKDDLINRVNSQILAGNLERAIAVCSQAKSPITEIIKAGLMAVSNRRDAEEVQTAMDAVALREIPKIEKRTGLLALVANIATLLGLLGTIAGLIGAFGAVAGLAPAEKATMLSNSISTAMNCTAFGLLVAIPLLAMYGFLQSRSQEMVDDIHEVAVTTLNFILNNRDKFRERG